MSIVYLPISLRQLSHELRTPLTGILGLARELSSEESLTNKQKRYVKDIAEAAERLQNLADLLLKAKRIKA